ncbi:MAG TPA: 7-cyano-7-deazaguanine synthase, partial [Methanoregulaceae archaeon]|nr:7-cyano-7-deazaguanine synthase [Methanoregulaceae archaeon]
MDSATLVYYAREQGYQASCLHFNYGQRTERKERISAHTIATLVGAEEFLEVDLKYLTLFGGSSLTDRSLTVDTFQEDRTEIPNTYVPFR